MLLERRRPLRFEVGALRRHQPRAVGLVIGKCVIHAVSAQHDGAGWELWNQWITKRPFRGIRRGDHDASRVFSCPRLNPAAGGRGVGNDHEATGGHRLIVNRARQFPVASCQLTVNSGTVWWPQKGAEDTLVVVDKTQAPDAILRSALPMPRSSVTDRGLLAAWVSAMFAMLLIACSPPSDPDAPSEAALAALLVRTRDAGADRA